MDKRQQLLANMHTFSVAARYLSFTQAGSELNLTQSAVSHRIKNLEMSLGFKLFVRLTRRMELTPEGERLLSTLNRSFESIFSELEDIRSNELSGELCVGTSLCFASLWLLPRLDSFREQYPSLNIRLITKERQLDFEYEPVDAAIFYSYGHFPGFHCQHLFLEKRAPICSPEYAERYGLLEKGIEGLREVTFIHSSHSKIWRLWLSEMGADIDCQKKRLVLNYSDLDVMAARQSLGVAIGRQRFTRQYIESGELISPFPAIDTDMGYDLVCPEGMQYRPKFVAFSRWVAAQVEHENKTT